MKNIVQNRFQGALGLITLAAAGFVVWCHLGGLTFEERPVRALAEAEKLAFAALDYRQDTGEWPRNPDGDADLTLLLGDRSGRMAIAEASATPGGLEGLGRTGGMDSGSATHKSWIRDLPLDPWGRPYRVVVSGTAVVVLSTGPDRELNTDPVRMWSRPEGMNPCEGDDLGVILPVDPSEGTR